MKSIRRRLNRTLLQALALLVAAFGVVFHLAFREALIKEFDASQTLLAQSLAARFEQLADGQVEFDPTPQMADRFTDRPYAEYFQVWRRADGLSFRSPSLRDADLSGDQRPLSQTQTWDLTLPDGRSGRAVGFEFEPRIDLEDDLPTAAPESVPGRLTLIYARSREFLNRTLTLSLLTFAGLAVLLPLCAAALLGRTVRKGLAPLDRLCGEIRSLTPGDPGHRFDEAGVPEELRPIVGRLNDLLDRMDQAFEREKRFSSNVAHELRTPIAELRTIAEVGLGSDSASAESPAELRLCLREALEIAIQMERVVTALFTLRRAQRGESGPDAKPLDLAGLVGRTWDIWKGRAEARRLACELVLPATAEIKSDETLLQVLLSNVLGNAVCHAPSGGRVECRLNREDGQLVVTVANTNSDLEQSDLSHIFEPFWRKDPARSGAEHAGLGLSTAAAFSQILGLRIAVRLPRPTWLEVRIEIPRPESTRNARNKRP